MTEKRHLIEEAIFEIAFDSRENALRQKSELAAYVQEILLPLANEVFDEIAAGGGVVHLDRLEIDLGAIPLDGFQEEMAERFREKLKSALQEKIEALCASPSANEFVFNKAQAERNQLEQFLESGATVRLPASSTAKPLDEWLINALRTEGEPFTRYLKGSPHQAVIIKRLARQFGHAALTQMAQRLAPEVAKIAAIVSALERAGSEQRREGWERLLQILIAPESGSMTLLAALEAEFSQGGEQRHQLAQRNSPGEGERSRYSNSESSSDIEHSFLLARWEAALLLGNPGGIRDVWHELRRNHGYQLRAIFMRCMEESAARRRLAEGFPPAMLMELAQLLTPSHATFIRDVWAQLSSLDEPIGGGAPEYSLGPIFWHQTLSYLYTAREQFERETYARELMTSLGEAGISRDVIATELRRVDSTLRISPSDSSRRSQADELYRNIIERLAGYGQGDLAREFELLGKRWPERFKQLYRQLQSGDVRLMVGKLSAAEAKTLVHLFIGITSEGEASGFGEEIEKHASRAQQKGNYYRHILQKLVAREIIDLDAAMDGSATAEERERFLQSRLESALVGGDLAAMDDCWDELRRHHAPSVREMLLRLFGDEKLREQVGEQFPEALLLEMAALLIPQGSHSISVVARNVALEEAALTGNERSLQKLFWKHLLAYLHEERPNQFERQAFANYLERRLPNSAKVRRALVRAVTLAGPATRAIPGARALVQETKSAALSQHLEQLLRAPLNASAVREVEAAATTHSGVIASLIQRGEVRFDLSALTDAEAARIRALLARLVNQTDPIAELSKVESIERRPSPAIDALSTTEITHEEIGDDGMRPPLEREALLRARLEVALVLGNSAPIVDSWSELCRVHKQLVRETFANCMGDALSRRRLAEGFPPTLLLQLAQLLVPDHAALIEALSAQLKAASDESVPAGDSLLADFWYHTLTYLYASGAQFQREGFVRELMEHLIREGAERTCIERALRKADASLLFQISSAAKNVPSANEGLRSLIERIERGADGDLAQEIEALGKTSPPLLKQLYRQLQLGEATLNVARLSTAAAKQLVLLFLDAGSEGDSFGFREEIKKYASRARHEGAYYRHILARLIANQIIDLEAAMMLSAADEGETELTRGAGQVIDARVMEAEREVPSIADGRETRTERPPVERAAELRTRLEEAMTLGRPDAVAEHWKELLGKDELLRELFKRHMSDESARRRLADGFPPSMLLDLAQRLIPAQGVFIEALFQRLEEQPGDLSMRGSVVRHFWYSTLTYLHTAGVQFRREEYLRGLSTHLMQVGMARDRVEALLAHDFSPVTESPAVVVQRSEDQIRLIAERLAGKGDGELSQEIEALGKRRPEEFREILRLLQSGELRLEAARLSAKEARALVLLIARFALEGEMSGFCQAIEKHANLARDEGAYYRHLLEQIAGNQNIDLEVATAAELTHQGAPQTEGRAQRIDHLQARFEAALAKNEQSAIDDLWKTMGNEPTEVMRQVWLNQTRDEPLRHRLVERLPESLLLEIAESFAPGAKALLPLLLASDRLRHASPGLTSASLRVLLWEYLFAYLHEEQPQRLEQPSFARYLSQRLPNSSPTCEALLSVVAPVVTVQRAIAANGEHTDSPLHSATAERDDALYQRLMARLQGGSGDVADLLHELTAHAPERIRRLYEEWQRGRFQPVLSSFSKAEVRQFVFSYLDANENGAASEFRRAIQTQATRAADEERYYRFVLAGLIADQPVDLELAVQTSRDSREPNQSREARISETKNETPSLSETSAPMRDTLKREREAKRVDEVYIANAGMVLAAPYLPRLFNNLGLLNGSKFKDEHAAERAVHLLQFMVNGSCDSPEFLLVLNKLLCGVPLELPVVREIELTPAEREGVTGLIQGMIHNWKIIGNTSVQGLRESFLQRAGRLCREENGWRLQVEKRGIDVLLDHLPWSFSLIKHGWMSLPVYVEWR